MRRLYPGLTECEIFPRQIQDWHKMLKYSPNGTSIRESLPMSTTQKRTTRRFRTSDGKRGLFRLSAVNRLRHDEERSSPGPDMPPNGLRWIAPLLLLMVVGSASLTGCTKPAKSSVEQSGTAQAPVRGVLEELVAEPVFEGKCYVYEAGRDHPYTVVLVHGIGEGAARDWEHVIPALARQYHVVAFDLPGFGRSEKQNALYSPANYAAFVRWIMETRVNGPFTLVGHSMGGVIALRFASIYPRDLRHLILIDTPGILHRSVAFSSAVSSAADSWLGRLRSGASSIMDSILAKMDNRAFTPDADVILASRSLRLQILKGRPDLIAGLALAQEDFSRRLMFVTQPVTLLWGTRDTVAPIRIAKALIAKLPRAQLIELPGLGHSPMTEAPDRFDELLLKHIHAATLETPVPQKATPSEQVGRFSDESGRSLSGAYKRLEIENCDDFKLEGLTAQSIKLTNSTVSIENSRIVGGQNALEAYDSHVTMTGGLLDADVAIVADRSDLDLAGVRIRGKTAIIKTEEWARLVLSICEAYLGDKVWYLHGIEELNPEALPWPKLSH
jgi:pimeloyl-ACP methyl ester carboxylesterase